MSTYTTCPECGEAMRAEPCIVCQERKEAGEWLKPVVAYREAHHQFSMARQKRYDELMGVLGYTVASSDSRTFRAHQEVIDRLRDEEISPLQEQHCMSAPEVLVDVLAWSQEARKRINSPIYDDETFSYRLGETPFPPAWWQRLRPFWK